MPSVIAMPPGTPYCHPLQDLALIKGKFKGSILVVGSGPSARENVPWINAVHIPRMLCSGGHYADGYLPFEFVWVSDSFWLQRKFPIKPSTVLITRGLIADPLDQLKVCGLNWYHWLDHVKLEMYSGPAAIRGAMYLGFETVYYIGMDGGADPYLGIDYFSSKLQVEEIKREFPGIVLPWTEMTNGRHPH